MPFNTVLSTNISKKQLQLFLLVFVLLQCLLFIRISYSGNPSPDPTSTVKQLLDKAATLVDHAPERAEQEVVKALLQAQQSRQPQYEIQAYILLGKIYNIKGLRDKAMDAYLKAQTAAKKQGLAKELCEASIWIGEIKYKRGNYLQSRIDFLYADSIARVNDLGQLRAYTLYYIGKYNQTTGNLKASNRYYHQALDIARKYTDNRLLTLVLPSLGKYYISEGKLYLALQCYLEALQLSGQLNDYLLNADICNHLGGLYLQMDEYAKALSFHQKALAYRKKMNNPEGLAKSYNNIGKAYFELKQPDSALFYYRKSLVLCEAVGYKKGMIKAQINLGTVYLQEQQIALSKQLLTQAFESAQKTGYDAGIAESSLVMANLYKALHNPDTAIYYYHLSLSKFEKTNYDEELRNIYQGLYDCYYLKQDYKQALAYHAALLEEEKQLLNVENNRQLALLNIAYDTERKEKNYQVLLKDNALKASLLKSKNSVIWLVIVALGFTLVLCLYIYNRFYRKQKANHLLEALNERVTRQNAELEKLNKELEQLGKEKDQLFSIISHELRNPLYWLQNLAEALSTKYTTMQPEKIKKTLSSLDESAKNVYHLMDNLLYWSRSKLNRIHPRKSQHVLQQLVCETTQMYDTFLLQKEISLSNRLAPQTLIYADPNLFSCVIRNLLSNAIKYTPRGGSICISSAQTADTVTLLISDSGAGMSSSTLEQIFSADIPLSTPGLMQEKGSGLGLKLCKDFVEMNDGRLWAESQPGEGTHFYFTVPLQKSEVRSQRWEVRS